jgi:hypothetical protein
MRESDLVRVIISRTINHYDYLDDGESTGDLPLAAAFSDLLAEYASLPRSDTFVIALQEESGIGTDLRSPKIIKR